MFVLTPATYIYTCAQVLGKQDWITRVTSSTLDAMQTTVT